ncbi:MAG: hypothetical protein ACJZ02_04270 [Candidatus Neomarinimicrobiota bacterium]
MILIKHESSRKNHENNIEYCNFVHLKVMNLLKSKKMLSFNLKNAIVF